MKSILAVLLIVLSMSAAAPCEDKGEKAASDSATHWLAQVDSGDYAASWETASPMFKQSISQDQWAKMLKAKRGPMGKVLSRTLKVGGLHHQPARRARWAVRGGLCTSPHSSIKSRRLKPLPHRWARMASGGSPDISSAKPASPLPGLTFLFSELYS